MFILNTLFKDKFINGGIIIVNNNQGWRRINIFEIRMWLNWFNFQKVHLIVLSVNIRK